MKNVFINGAFKHLHEYNPKNILHIGGHTAEEAEIYKEIGADFTFVEPVPEFAEIIRKKGYKVIEAAVGTEPGEREFNVCSVFSSFLFRKKECLAYQDRWMRKSKEKQRKIMVKIIRMSDIDGNFDTLVVDTEGTVLDVLKSGELNFETIVAEVRETPAYNGEPDNNEIEKYLNEKGYSKISKHGNNTIFRKKAYEK